MRQAVRVGRQILLPRSVHRAKPEFKVWQRYPAQTSGRWSSKDCVPSVSNASFHWDGSTWSLELLTFLPNQPGQRPFYSCDGLGVGEFAGNCPIAGSQTWVRKSGPVDRWTGEIALPGELGALDGPVL